MRQRIILLFSLFLSIGNLLGQERIVCDETCDIGTDTKSAAITGAAGYAVVSPVGRGTVEPIEQAHRLNTLNGKTIAVVGVSFMSRVTHPEIKRLIEKHYPDAKVILLDEIGTAGPYPAPGITRRAKDDFQQRLREMKVDAVISGNGGCGLCTPKEVGSCLAAEHIGIPSVIICAPGFTNQARYTSLNNGVPVMRVAEYPGAFALDSEEVLIKNTREILWPQIVDALTRPITAEETDAALKSSHGDLRDDVFFGTLEEVNAYFSDMKWSDGLPIIPPTFERVNEMMRFTDFKWDETVAVLPIAHRNTTAWHVAVNGVMAGCKPEMMPMSWCMAEDETACQRIRWQPYHVRAGYQSDDNTITAASTLLWGNNMAPSTTDPKRIAQLMAWDISERCQFALGSGRQFTFRTILLTEPVARILAQRYTSAEKLEDYLIGASRRPLSERAFANYYANPGGAKDGGEHNIRQYTGHLRRTEGATMTIKPEWHDSPDPTIETILTMQKGMTQFLITGDASRNKVQTMPGGGYSTVKIELPNNWDELMSECGYKPLYEFKISNSNE